MNFENFPQPNTVESHEKNEGQKIVNFLREKLVAFKDKILGADNSLEKKLKIGKIDLAVMAAIAALSTGEVKAEESRLDDLSALAEKASIITLDEIHNDLERYNLSLPQGAESIASISHQSRRSIDNPEAEEINIEQTGNINQENIDQLLNLGVNASSRLAEKNNDSLFKSQVELFTLGEQELEHEGEPIEVSELGKNSDEAFILAMKEIAKQVETRISGVRNLKRSEVYDSQDNSLDFQESFINILSSDSQVVFQDVQLLQTETVSIDGESFVKVRVKATPVIIRTGNQI